MSNPIEKVKEHERKLTEPERLERIIERMAKEVNAAKVLLWATVKTAGGRVDIPDNTMRSVNERCKIASRYDPVKQTTIIESEIDLIIKP